MVFDDSFEHEVVHDGDADRYVLCRHRPCGCHATAATLRPPKAKLAPHSTSSFLLIPARMCSILDVGRRAMTHGWVDAVLHHPGLGEPKHRSDGPGTAPILTGRASSDAPPGECGASP